MLKKLLKKSLPLQLVLCIVFAFIFGDQLSHTTIRCLYTISCVLKEILMAVLPIMIFSYIFAALLSLEKNAPLLIIFILGMVIASNALVSFTSYGVGRAVLPFITITQHSNVALTQEMMPYFVLGIPKIVSPDKAMLTGIVLGILFCFFQVAKVTKAGNKLQRIVTAFLEKCFIPFLPLYVLGFVLKMHYEGNLSVLFQNYAQVFVLICILIICYISLMYLIANNFSWTNFKKTVKQMSAAGLTGFSTVSSAITMPVTIDATEANIKDKQFSRLIIPATVNIHMIGHGLSIPITSLTILMLCGHPLPSLESFALFVVFFCLAKFSATAVPGGGIIVILPILQSQLGFTPEMSSIIIMLDILQDAVLTGANVMGNGAFAIICYRFGKFCKLLKK